MTCDLYFYLLNTNLYGKNFIFDDISYLLSGLTPLHIEKFQYLRFELDMTIRVNMTQDIQLSLPYNLNTPRYNYLKITTKNASNNVATYYYFITGKKQVSQSTIEFTLRMDTLNTFHYSGTTAGNTYSLSRKSLVLREHKDRNTYVTNDTRHYTISVGNVIDEQDIHDHEIESGDNIFIDPQNIEDTDPTLQFSGNYQIFISLFDRNTSSAVIGYTGKNWSVYSNLGYICFDYTDMSGNAQHEEFYGADYYFVIRSVSQTQLDYMFNNHICAPYVTYFRFITLTPDKYYLRNIDTFEEGISTNLFKRTTDTTLLDSDENKHWYVCYSSANTYSASDTISDVKYVNPVQVSFYFDDGYKIQTSGSHPVRIYASSSLIPQWVNTAEELSYDLANPSPAGDQYIQIGTTQYDFHDYSHFIAKRTGNNDTYFSEIRFTGRTGIPNVTLYNIDSFIIYGINTLYCSGFNRHVEIYVGSGAGTYAGTATGFDNLDLTDPQLLKCFCFPYAPMKFLVGKNGSPFTSLPEGVIFNSDNVLELQKQQNPLFNYDITFSNENPQQVVRFTAAAPGYRQTRNKVWESKLFHSDFYQPKFVYDSFSFTFMLENLDTAEYMKSSYKDLVVNYACSQNVQSKFMFGFPQYVLRRGIQDYDNILLIERNNEKALFNNAYLNYIRSGGFSYDTKKAGSQNAVNGITTALSIVGSIASFAGAVAGNNPMLAVAGVGLAAGAVTSVVRNIHSAQEQDRAISQKLLQASMQGTSVQGSEDLDILTAFSGNKAKLVVYQLSEVMENAVWDLFHYCGYATHEQKIPDTNTRIYFNFIQAEIVYSAYSFADEIADDIAAKWKEGVTFMHKDDNNNYDLTQQYENYERSLFE